MSIDLIPWDKIKDRYSKLSELLNSPSIDNNKRHIYQKELSYLSTILNKHDKVIKLKKEYNELKSEYSEADKDMRELFKEEIESLDRELILEHSQLEDLMFPPDEIDARSVFLEIRAGAGGAEASLFANDLLKMYSAYGLLKNWKTEIVSVSQTDLGGYREVILHIKGKNVYGHLRYESGVHRVQRVPTTETSGRVHTSTATVAVLPEAKEIDIDFNQSDIRIDTYRASGAGGQHVNTTDSAVRLTHIPTGVVVSCQDERSQHKNKAKALKILQSRIFAAQKEKQETEMSQKRKKLVGGAMRSEKVRTYNFPQNRITDHQVNLTLQKLDVVLTGQLDEIINALQDQAKIERRKQPLSFNEDN